MPPSKERRDIRNLVFAGDFEGAKAALLDYLATNPPIGEKVHVVHALKHLDAYLGILKPLLPEGEPRTIPAGQVAQLERVKRILNYEPD